MDLRVSSIARRCVERAGRNHALAGLRDNILATSPFGSYGTRYQTAYSLLNVWDGKSAAAELLIGVLYWTYG